MRIIAGQYKGRQLQRPAESVTRPTSDRARESVFNILSHLPGFSLTDTVVLDMFSGSGAMGLEALSRGARSVKLIDKHLEARKILQQNVMNLKCQAQVEVLGWDALSLPIATSAVDLIFIDPPYYQNYEEIVIDQLYGKGWLKTGTLIVLETSKKTDFDFSNVPGIIVTTRTFASTKITIFSCSLPQNPN